MALRRLSPAVLVAAIPPFHHCGGSAAEHQWEGQKFPLFQEVVITVQKVRILDPTAVSLIQHP